MKPQNSRPENCGGISFLDNNEKKTRSTRYLKRLQTLLIVINVTENSKRCMQERCKKPGLQIELRKKFYISTL